MGASFCAGDVLRVDMEVEEVEEAEPEEELFLGDTWAALGTHNSRT